MAVLVSGHGSNLEALLAAAAGTGLEIVLVTSDRPGVRALDVATNAGVPTVVLPVGDFADRAAFDSALRDVVRSVRPDVVCLAGFMRILGPAFVRAFPARIVNTHPSLLPAFRGAHAVQDALAHGVRVTGCTVHLVDEEVDHGPILLQAPVEVRPDDDEQRLHARIKELEYQLLPRAVGLVARGEVVLRGRRAFLSGASPPDPSGA